MHRKLILIALLGMLMIAFASQGMAEDIDRRARYTYEENTDWKTKQEISRSTSEAHRVLNKADFVGEQRKNTRGASAEDWMNREVRGTPESTAAASRDLNDKDFLGTPARNTSGEDARDWMGKNRSQDRSISPEGTHPHDRVDMMGEQFTETRGANAEDWMSREARELQINKSNYHLYDSRDPQNSAVRPGGRTVRSK